MHRINTFENANQPGTAGIPKAQNIGIAGKRRGTSGIAIHLVSRNQRNMLRFGTFRICGRETIGPTALVMNSTLPVAANYAGRQRETVWPKYVVCCNLCIKRTSCFLCGLPMVASPFPEYNGKGGSSNNHDCDNQVREIRHRGTILHERDINTPA